MRRRMTELLASLSQNEIARRSAAAARRFMDTEAWSRSDTILCFLSMPRELDTDGLIAAARASGRRVAVPRIEGGVIRFLFLPPDAGTLPRDAWGIPVPDPAWEPFDPRDARGALVAAPGLAFDRAGNRLGRGKGFYDGFLRSARAAGGAGFTAIGLCLSEQIVEEVPHTERDERLQGVVSDLESVLLS
ncbi:MAG TPA: 5-formyltetrahydrofolate cyclo-ligase [Spirochaetia bacterium]|nr:5-formyltetrahydrofolate cyclo-ligase [Spirochaetia bacterium]